MQTILKSISEGKIMVTNLNIHLLNQDLSKPSQVKTQAQALVLFAESVSSKDTAHSSKKSNDTPLAKLTPGEAHHFFAEAIKDKLITGKRLEVCSFKEVRFAGFRHVIVAGIGSNIDHENVRQVAAAIYKELKAMQLVDVVVNFDGLTTAKKHQAEFVKAFVEGTLLSSYSFDELKSETKKTNEKKLALNIHLATKFAADKNLKSAFAEATILASCANFSKRLGDMPGNLMTPTVLAKEAVEAAKGTGVKVTVWDKARITKEKMGGLLGVAQGSAQDPKFIIMEYKGAAASKAPVVFVGKGLTFDTGGISLKPGAAMEEMKYDMCGGANVIGTLLAIAKLKLKINAVGLVPATENMPGSKATKPGDVHTARNGKTFEINNTDAEGRLILSDALCYASELKPQVIIDAATLTGAMVMALGNIHTGYFTRNKNLKSTVEAAAEISGELVWNMPLCDYHVKDMKGTFADLSNISSGKGAGSATAAAFLEQFVDEGIPWAHFDIAGTGWGAGNRLNYCTAKGATGAMVRTFVEIAKSYE